MFTVKIVVHCPDGLSEVLADSMETAALAVEDGVSQVLTELFGTVLVDTVTVSYVPPMHAPEDVSSQPT